MTNEKPTGQILRSWKEIAAYLGFDERTCYRWEKKYGLPVHRANGGSSKSHVVAYKDELDRWFRETFKSGEQAAAERAAGPRPGRRRALLIIPAAAVILTAILLAVRPRLDRVRRLNPVDFAVKGSKLIALSQDGEELWTWDSGLLGLNDDGYYRARFQEPDPAETDIRLPLIVIKDINSDGWNEVVFAVKKRQDAFGEGLVHCFDRSGARLWSFTSGREMAFGGNRYSADYRIYGFCVSDLDSDGDQEVVVVGYQYPQWPCQVAVLETDGRMIGEYWHSGQVKDVCFGDLDGDGRGELILAGVNNEHGPCIVVFDPADVKGASPQTGGFKCDEAGPGSEKYYIRLPRTDISLAKGEVAEALQKVALSKSGTLYAHYAGGLILYFDPGLRCLRVDWGHDFIRERARLAAQGLVHGALDDAYAERVKSGIRYWDGSRWVAEPTRADSGRRD